MAVFVWGGGGFEVVGEEHGLKVFENKGAEENIWT